MSLYHLMNRGVIAKLQHPVRQGKESLVLHALAPNGIELAVKIHNSRVFGERERKQYLFGDWRLRHAKRHITLRTEAIWAEKEFRNLYRLEKARVPAPRPISFLENIVVMSFIGENGEAAMPLKALKDFDYEKIASKLLPAIERLVIDAHLVHGDLSPYNILVWRKEPYIIDLSQAVLTTHPDTARLLKRDMQNLRDFFAQYGLDTEAFDLLSQELLEEVKKPPVGQPLGNVPLSENSADVRR